MTYKINELNGEPWITAIHEVITKANTNLGLNLMFERDKYTIDLLADSLGIRFTRSGMLVEDAKALETLYE